MDQGWAMVIGGALAAIPTTISAILSVRTRTAVRKVGADAAAVKDQVQNSHATNLREEQDDRHRTILTEFNDLRAWLREELRDIHRDITRLSTDQSQDRADIRQLEHKTHRSRNGNEDSGQH